jgi:hypothetical protein
MVKIGKGLKAYQAELKRQRKEHPTLPAWALRTVVKDHLKKAKKNYG